MDRGTLGRLASIPKTDSEPTASLDPQRAREVLELLHATCRAEGASLLTVTHDRSHLGRFDRVLDLGEVPA